MSKIIIFLEILLTFTAFSQVIEKNILLGYSAKVSAFDTSGAVVSSAMQGEFEVKNKNGDVLRFMLDNKQELSAYHCGIAFILYGFDKGWISSISFYDKNGALKGDEEFDDIARTELEIKEMGLLHAKFESLDAADGNLTMNDSDMKIVYRKTFSSKGMLIKEEYINTSDYWKMQHLVYRP